MVGVTETGPISERTIEIMTEVALIEVSALREEMTAKTETEECPGIEMKLKLSAVSILHVKKYI